MMPSSSQANRSSQSLKGRRVVVTAIDLEQSEHRGIASYSKALIRALKQAGAEVWLLTQFDSSKDGGGLKELPVETKEIIHTAKVLDSLANGAMHQDCHWLESRLKIAGKLRYWLRILRASLYVFSPPTFFSHASINKITLSQLVDNPNLRSTRLNYLKDVEGLLCAKKIFHLAEMSARFSKKNPLMIDLRGFDILITSCPLNIKPVNLSIFVQTIHDLIALEYVPHNQDMRIFSRRLQACLDARKIYVSNSTAMKYNNYIQKSYNQKFFSEVGNVKTKKERVVLQPPSLSFPFVINNDTHNCEDIPPSTHLLRAFKEDQITTDLKSESLTSLEESIDFSLNNSTRKEYLIPFQYLLFNSSIEPRKNILFLLQSFAESRLGSIGYKLCIMGKFKTDAYSSEIKNIISNNSSILLTGYVDEKTKLDLYLNSLLLLSPSLVEGFGIPLLDAACLGMQGIASNCNAHQEIRDHYDFSSYVQLIDTLDSHAWAVEMRNKVSLLLPLNGSPEEIRCFRIHRYQKKYASINDSYSKSIVDLLID